jgi:NAD(P) transhydrogenase
VRYKFMTSSDKQSYHYDVIVLGTGPAGESAAMNAAKHGLKAIVIEDQPQVGGSCTHKGTIPSKALREIVRQVSRFNSNPIFMNIVPQTNLAFPELLSAAEAVVTQQVSMRSRFYLRNEIKLYTNSLAKLIDSHTVEITHQDGSFENITGGDIIIATGSRPYQPDDVDFSHPRIYDSDSILEMQHTPNKLIIYGAGVIGCEYASIFSSLGIKVNLINTRDRLLEFLDDEISDALTYHLRGLGAMIRHREEYKTIEATDKGVTLTTQSGKKIFSDAILWCNGRAGNTASLNLASVGLEADFRGQLNVNKRYQTAVENIYAVGDVVGWPSLASAAYDQGRSAAASSRGKETCRYVDEVAMGIYTIPEISSVGKTESELTEACIPYEVGKAFFKDIARAQIRNEKVGMLKILFHIETLEILGIHCFGADATEIIHIGQAIFKQEDSGNTLRYFVSTTFNYPTMAEAYRVAALNGLNRLSNSV